MNYSRIKCIKYKLINISPFHRTFTSKFLINAKRQLLLIAVMNLLSLSCLLGQSAFIGSNTTMTYDQCAGTATVIVQVVQNNDNSNLSDRLGYLGIYHDNTLLGSVSIQAKNPVCPTGDETTTGTFTAGAGGDTEETYQYCGRNGSGLTARRKAQYPTSGWKDIEITIPFTRIFAGVEQGGIWDDLFGTSPEFEFIDRTYHGVNLTTFTDHTFNRTPSNGHLKGIVPTSVNVIEECGQVVVTWNDPSEPAGSCPSSAWGVKVYKGVVLIGTVPAVAPAGGGPKATPGAYTHVVTPGPHNYKVETFWNFSSGRDHTSAKAPTNGKDGSSIDKLDPTSFSSLQGTCDNGEIVLTWNLVTGADGYEIERSTSSSFATFDLLVPITNGNQISVTDDNLTLGVPYHYRIFVINECGDRSDSSISPHSMAIPPSSPAKPTAPSAIADNANNSIVVKWTDDSVDEDNFVVVRTLINGTGPPTDILINESDPKLMISGTGATGRIFTYEDAPPPCQSYAYTIKARNTCGDGETGSIPQVRIDPDLTDAFSPPGGTFNGSKGAYTDRVQLNWTSDDDQIIESYRISRRTMGSGAPFVLLQEVTGGGIYQDLISDAGIFYEYSIVGLATCESVQIQTVPDTTIGFRSKSGIITGNVAYEGGIDVANVKIKADRDVNATGTSLLLNGCNLSIPHNASTQQIDGNLLLETWIKPVSYGAPFTVISKAGAYELLYANSTYTFKVHYAGGMGDITMSSSELPTGTWKSLAAQVRADSLFIYVDGEKKASGQLTGSVNVLDPVSPINIGNGLDGYLKEMRIWKVLKTDLEVDRLSKRYVTSSENGLVALLPMTEGNGNFAYDRSKKTTSTFNDNHAEFNEGCGPVMWVTDAPTQNQLSYIAYTSATGSYTLNLPYTNAGETYTLTPSFPAHSFNPTDLVLFVGNSSTVINGVDFVDESAFLVSGFLKYKDNLNCPVADAFLKVDGQIVLEAGEPVKTRGDGYYEIKVPIGLHFVSVEKPAHVFNIGRFPPAGLKDFQKDETSDFEDSTLVRIVGRVVGGTIEGDKKPGLQLSKNNIGRANLTFAASDGCMTDTTSTDAEFGEYDIELPPMRFDPTVDMFNGIDHDFASPAGSGLDQINLVNPIQPTTVKDILLDPFGQVISIDSVTFEKRIDYIHRVDPKIIVTQNDGIRPFIGDTLYNYVNPIDLTTIERNLWNEPMRWPVFANVDDTHFYRCIIKVYEEYVNADNSEIDSVPTVDGTLFFENELSNDPMVSVKLADFNDPDTLRGLIYSFQLGVSNLLYNHSIPDYSFTRKFGIRLEKANGQIIPWNPFPLLSGMNDPSGGDGFYRGYILAPRTDGEQFVTNGPEYPEFILRDPPGSNSFAQRNTGSTTTKSESWAWNAGGSAFTNDKITAGADFAMGIGVLIQNKTDFKTEIGFKAEISGGRNGSLNKTITNTESWKTNSAASKVGSASDLFIGTSQNLQFGITEILSFVPEDLCGVSVTCIDSMNYLGLPFRPAILSGLSLVPGSYETGFIYSEIHIKNIVIPQLLSLRDIALTEVGTKYSDVLPIDDPNFGKNNDDPDFTNAVITGPNPGFEVLEGPSYKYNAINLEDSLTGDVVRHFNDQMVLWEKALWLNEWEKVRIEDQIWIDSLKTEEIAAVEEEYLADKIAFIALAAFEAGGGIPIAYGIIANPLPGTAAGGFATFAVTSAVSIANAEVAQRYIEYKFKLDQIEDRFEDTAPKNKSFSSGASYSSSTTSSLASSIQNSFEYTLSAGLKLTLEGLINNNGVGLEKGLNLNFKNTRKWGESTSESESVSYTLSDNDFADFYTVDIYPSLLGWGPIFKRRPGGLTSCPYEGEDLTDYYNKGTVIHPATQQVDAPTISVGTCCLSGIPADQPAVFNLTLGNLGASNLTRTYELALVSASNPFGAIVRIDGAVSNTVTIPAGGSVQKTLTIEKGAGGVFDYNLLEIIIYPECDKLKLKKSVFLSASFIPVCTPVTLSDPNDLWVLNNNFKDTMPIRIQEYNYNTFGLDHFIFGKKSADEPNFTPIRRFYRDTLPDGVLATDADSFTNATTFIDYEWDVDGEDDGTFDLQITAVCKVQGNDVLAYSDAHRGYMDRINPRAFGTPSPGDGILDPDDDVLLTMNETVDIGSITDQNFEVFGRINGATMGPGTEHKASIAFDGVSSLGEIPEYQLQKRSLTIEFWVKRNDQGSEVVLSQGLSDADQLLVFFHTDNTMRFKLGGNTFESDEPIPADEWHHCAIIYDRDNNQCTIFIVGAGMSDTFEKSGTFITDYTSTGVIGVGKHIVGGLPLFDGNLHGLRLWNIPKTTSQINSGRTKVFSGREAGLIGYWAMDEAAGATAEDIVRSRHMSLTGTTWSILPANHSYNFDESQEYLEATNVGPLVFREETDLTFEGWIKAGNSGKQTILSTGKPTSTTFRTWDIHYDGSSNELVITNDNMTLSTPMASMFSGIWHHFAIVVERSRSVSIYIDGNLVNTGTSSDFSGFAGVKLWVGCRGWVDNFDVEHRDQYFDGNIDELRIWSSARKPEQIARDRVFQLEGDEFGLQVYYPFDDIILNANNNPTRVATLEDAVVKGLSLPAGTGFDLLLGAGNTLSFTETDAPTVKLPRVRERLRFDYVINDDKIFIDILNDPDEIENVTIDITVKDLKDLAGNIMQSEETWIAYINKNQVFWDQEYFNLEKSIDDALSFTTTIHNTGGSQEQYSISNLPDWLTASTTFGNIEPNSSIEVTFTVQSLLNIGEYEQDIFLTTQPFNFNERLLLDLKVFKDPPDWLVDGTDFFYDMNIIGQLRINDILSTDDEDIVSVWVNDTLRGFANIEFDDASGKYLVFLTVHSNDNNPNIEQLEFRAWDASRGSILVDLIPDDEYFSVNDILGTLSTPVPIEATVFAERTYALNAGWNWVSFPLASTTLDSIELTLEDLSPVVGDLIKSKDNFYSYDGTWSGNIPGFNTNDGYKIKSTNADEFSYNGSFMNPGDEPITIGAGWNWIGVKSEFNIEIETVLFSLDSLNTGDVIKGQGGFAQFDSEFGWGGSLDFFEPQKGYMLFSNHDGELLFPDNGQSQASFKEPDPTKAFAKAKIRRTRQKSLGFQLGKYSSTMSLVADIDECMAIDSSGNPLDLSDWHLAAYVDGEMRGISEVNWVDVLGKFIYYLSIEGDETAILNFKLLHATDGNIIDLEQNLTYNVNQITGTARSPFNFTCSVFEPCADDVFFRTADIDDAQSLISKGARLSLKSDAILSTGISFRFAAGEEIELLAGFETVNGAVLQAFIESCNNPN